MRFLAPCFALTTMLSLTFMAQGGPIEFTTQDTATQTLTSPLFGGSVSITATGPQVFTIDPSTGFAGVTSAFKGNDFPDPFAPGTFWSYNLYNTQTTGTVTTTMSGSYDVDFKVLFELKLTSGPLNGLIFETLNIANFEADNIPSLPFPSGTAFSDPSGNDTVPIYVKTDPTGTFPSGALIGFSSDRIVTIGAVVPSPEPSTLVLFATGAGVLGIFFVRGRWAKGRSSAKM